jgi:hypothetical protein
MATGMKQFFKDQLLTLKDRTGYNQFEKLQQEENWREKANQLIQFMVDECNRAPLNMVRDEVKQRVIAQAIVDDHEFTGLNAKFVRKALNAWWHVYGGKLLEARDQIEKTEGASKPVAIPEELVGVPVDTLINEYLKKLRDGTIKEVPDVSERQAREEGQDRPKGHAYHSTDRSYKKQIDERVRKGRELYFRENYPGGTEEQLQQYLNSFEK